MSQNSHYPTPEDLELWLTRLTWEQCRANYAWLYDFHAGRGEQMNYDREYYLDAFVKSEWERRNPSLPPLPPLPTTPQPVQLFQPQPPPSYQQFPRTAVAQYEPSWENEPEEAEPQREQEPENYKTGEWELPIPSLAAMFDSVEAKLGLLVISLISSLIDLGCTLAILVFRPAISLGSVAAGLMLTALTLYSEVITILMFRKARQHFRNREWVEGTMASVMVVIFATFWVFNIWTTAEPIRWILADLGLNPNIAVVVGFSSSILIGYMQTQMLPLLRSRKLTGGFSVTEFLLSGQSRWFLAGIAVFATLVDLLTNMAVLVFSPVGAIASRLFGVIVSFLTLFSESGVVFFAKKWVYLKIQRHHEELSFTIIGLVATIIIALFNFYTTEEPLFSSLIGGDLPEWLCRYLAAATTVAIGYMQTQTAPVIWDILRGRKK